MKLTKTFALCVPIAFECALFGMKAAIQGKDFKSGAFITLAALALFVATLSQSESK